MAKQRPSVQVELPNNGSGGLAWKRVCVFAVVGLLIGISWPLLTGVHIGPQLPGAKKAALKPSAKVVATAKPSVLPVIAKPAGVKRSNKQRVVVRSKGIKDCYDGKTRLEADRCGPLRVDRLFVPSLKQLADCPSALGLSGELDLGFELRFRTRKNEVRVLKPRKNKIPSTTVRGLTACIADYIADVKLEKVLHKYSKYRIYYVLTFYPPGTEPPQQTASATGDEKAGDDADSRGLAAVSWDTALVRDEPSTGKVIARLIRGTRVQILGRRKDWYRIKVGGREGWVYRGAIGL